VRQAVELRLGKKRGGVAQNFRLLRYSLRGTSKERLTLWRPKTDHPTERDELRNRQSRGS